MKKRKNRHQEIIMISGASQGIGFAIAERLGKNGAKISICARREEPLRQAERRLKEEGIDLLATPVDVSQPEEVERWFAATEARFGPASILVNNAGISGFNPLLEIREEAWDRTLSVNCRGVFLCTKRALPAMIQAQRGRILMLSSVSSKYFRREHSLYFASKWALNGFSHCLAKEVNEHNIHVHLICPGMTETNFFESMGGRPHPQENRYADPAIYAELAEYLCTLPEQLDTLEMCLLPEWQIKNFGIRR